MQHITKAAIHTKHSIIGTLITLTLGFIGKMVLSDVALIMGILSGLVTGIYTCWKWHNEWQRQKKQTHKPNTK